MLGGARLAAIFCDGAALLRRCRPFAVPAHQQNTPRITRDTRNWLSKPPYIFRDFVYSWLYPVATSSLDASALRILQGELQLFRQSIDGRPLSLPCAVGFEAERANATSPRRDHAANGAIVGA